MWKEKNRLGFTLIELLVVIGIIGILIALSLVGMQNARKDARDARRKTDLETIRSALEMYKGDVNAYPGSLGTSISYGTNVYLTEVPDDPLSTQDYAYSVLGSGYVLCAALEEDPSMSTTSCGNCGNTCNYKTTSP